MPPQRYLASPSIDRTGLLEVVEHRSPKYTPCILANAKAADLTVAFAVNFDTRGERLTRKAAGNFYLALPLDGGRLGPSRLLYGVLQRNAVRTLNIAGNSIQTLTAAGWTQSLANQQVFDILAIVACHWPLERILCGGQTGVDLAGAIAGTALGIPTTMTLPKGLLQRNLLGLDEAHTPEEIRAQVSDGVGRLMMPPRIARRASLEV